MNEPLPLDEEQKLAPGYDRTIIESAEYKHTTVGSLIEILEDYPIDARVWLQTADPEDEDKVFIRPIEITAGIDGEVYLL